MDQKHYNELVLLSQEIDDQATNKLTNYCANKYCGISNDTTENQMEDYLFVAEETSAYLLGNALALLDPSSQEVEIKSSRTTCVICSGRSPYDGVLEVLVKGEEYLEGDEPRSLVNID